MSTATCPECHELVVRGLHPATGHVVLQEPWTSQGRRLAQGGEELWVTQAEGPARPVEGRMRGGRVWWPPSGIGCWRAVAEWRVRP